MTRLRSFRPSLIVNLALQQGGWFAAVLCAAYGRPIAGCAAALAAVAVHVFLSRSRADEAKLAGMALLLGFGIEAVIAATGAFRYASGSIAGGFVTPWALALWMQLATTLRFALGWMRGRPLAAAAFGAIGGPLAFRFGAVLGGGTIAAGVMGPLVLSAAWAVSMVVLVGWAGRPAARDGYRFERP